MIRARQHRTQPPAERGFTLLELLVVMAIIGVLAGLLLPAFGHVRGEAREVICRAYLRNLGIAVSLYAEQNGNALPVSDTVTNPHRELVTLLSPFGVDGRNFYCPSETAAARTFSAANLERGDIGYFYYSCENLPTDRNISRSLRWGDIFENWPRHLRTDPTCPGDSWVFSDTWFAGQPTAHGWSRKRVNYLTLDGGVHTIDEGPKNYFR